MSLKLLLCVLVLVCAISLGDGHFRFVRRIFNRRGKDVRYTVFTSVRIDVFR